MNSQTCDVVVVGAGNAALCAAIAAAEAGCKVVVVERAPVAESGGNSRYAAGAFRLPTPRRKTSSSWSPI